MLGAKVPSVIQAVAVANLTLGRKTQFFATQVLPSVDSSVWTRKNTQHVSFVYLMSIHFIHFISFHAIRVR
jgi:hypothetical protein